LLVQEINLVKYTLLIWAQINLHIQELNAGHADKLFKSHMHRIKPPGSDMYTVHCVHIVAAASEAQTAQCNSFSQVDT